MHPSLCARAPGAWRAALRWTFAPALLASLSLCSPPPARATLDAYVDTSTFVPGQPSTLTFVSTVTPDGPSWGVLCAFVYLRYDPAKVSVSNFQANTADGWSCAAYNLDNNASGWACAIFLNSADYGQTMDTAVCTFTVTPANSQVDIDDCDTFCMDGDYSELCDQAFYVTYPSNPCGGRNYPIETNPGEEEGSLSRGGWDPEPEFASSPVLDVDDAKEILRIAGGLASTNYDDLDAYDRNGDDKITVVDAVILLRTPYPAVPKGWYGFQGSKRRMGRTYTAVSRTATQAWTPRSLSTEGGSAAQPDLMPSVVAIPSPYDANLPVLYAVTTDGVNSRLYRIEDHGTYTSESHYDFPDPNDPNHGPREFVATGTPLVLPLGGVPGSESIIVTGNIGSLAAIFRVDYEASQTNHWSEPWPISPRTWTGSIYTGAGFYAGPLTYYQHTDTGCQLVNVPYGQAVIVAANAAIPNASTWGYMFAFNLADGARRWGRVLPNGDPLYAWNDAIQRTTVGGLVPFSAYHGFFAATYSSPSLKGDNVNTGAGFAPAGYAGDTSCYINARRLTDGAYLWEDAYNGSPRVDSSAPLFEDKVFFTEETGSSTVPVACALKEVPARTSTTHWWGVSASNSGFDGLTASWSTPVVHAESRTVIFGDDGGNAFGIGTDRNPSRPNVEQPDIRWPEPSVMRDEYDNPSMIRASPLIAANPGGQATVFVASGSNNGHVSAFDAVAGGTRVWDSGFLNGQILSSMAAYKGRLYVLSAGTDQNGPSLYCFR